MPGNIYDKYSIGSSRPAARSSSYTLLFDDHVALGSEQPTVSGIAGRQNAIHHIDATGHILRQLSRHADPMAYRGRLRGRISSVASTSFEAKWPGLTDRQTTDGVRIGVQIGRAVRIPAANRETWSPGRWEERITGPTLFRHPAGHGGTLAWRAQRTVRCCSAGQIHDRWGIFRAFIERHEDVAAESRAGRRRLIQE